MHWKDLLKKYEYKPLQTACEEVQTVDEFINSENELITSEILSLDEIVEITKENSLRINK